jgi:hypothetical protein
MSAAVIQSRPERSRSFQDRLVLAEQGDTRVVALRSWDELQPFEDFWRETSSHLETDPDFVSLVVRGRMEVLGPYVLAMTDRKGEPKALMIGRIEQTRLPIKLGYFNVAQLPVRQLVFVIEGLIGERSSLAAELMTAATVKALRLKHAQLAILENVPNDSPFHLAQQALPWLARGLTQETHPHWRGTLPESCERFLQNLSKRHRYEARYAAKAMQKAFPGQLEYREYQGPGDVQAFCAAAETVARTTYQRGLGVGFIDNEQNRALVQLSTDRNWWKAWVLFIQQRPAAFWSGMAYKGIFHLEWTAYDPGFAKSEPGTVLFLRVLESLCGTGLRQIDFGIGSALYKERFGDQLRTESSLRVYAPNLRGASLNLCYSGGVAFEAAARAALRHMRLADRLKRIWRSRAERREAAQVRASAA